MPSVGDVAVVRPLADGSAATIFPTDPAAPDYRAEQDRQGEVIVEAGKLVSYYGVDVLGVRRIEAKVYAYNILSMNSLRRNGFHQEGVLRQAGFDGTRYWDVVVFGILKDEIELAEAHE